jgi:glycerol uptake facilitator-like aquaporin
MIAQGYALRCRYINESAQKARTENRFANFALNSVLFFRGVAVAILIAGLIMSPPGRMTGGHMNPAISLAMWRFGVFPLCYAKTG